jgi:hypothetical protein
MKIRPVRLAGALLAVAVLAIGRASAATLTIDTSSLVAETVSAGLCDETVDVAWTTELGLPGLLVNDVTLSGIDQACDGHVFQITLGAALTNAALGSGLYDDPAGASGQISPTGGSNQSVTFDFTGQNVLELLVAMEAWSITP